MLIMSTILINSETDNIKQNTYRCQFRMLDKFLVVLLLAVSLCDCESVSLGVVHNVRASSEDLDWWQHAVFYQIYPRSFQDSNGDGMGDLKGITSKLQYLKDTGITATWLSPIFSSPGVDQGYDIKNYREIDEIFGTMADFDELIAEATKLGIKIILDFVPNHTSNEHEWFIKSENKEAGYENFYIWVDGDPKTPPNNWISAFSGTTWTWSEKREQYYYHQFAPQQPDLNYSNPAVVTEMKDVLKFWLDKGVGGFRMDAVNYLFEDPEFKDAPPARGYTECTELPVCQDKTLIMIDLDNTYDMIYQFREFIDQYVKDNKLNETKVIMTEAYSSIENTMLYYQSTDGTRQGAHFTFNFNFIVYLKQNFTVDDLSNAINKWLIFLPKGATSNWVLGNHDNNRVATRLGEENVDGFNMLTAFLPGVMVTYNGEEIGMIDGEVTCDQGKDPSATKNCTSFNETSRDFERTPFQWDDSDFAGFSNTTTWLPVGSSKNYINLESQNKAGVDSHYNIYKELLTFRKNFEKETTVDYLAVIRVSETILQIVRHRDEREYVYLFNIGDKEEKVDFYKKSNMYMIHMASTNSSHKPMSKVGDSLVMKPHESLILHSMNGAHSAVFSIALISLLGVVLHLF